MLYDGFGPGAERLARMWPHRTSRMRTEAGELGLEWRPHRLQLPRLLPVQEGDVLS